MMPIAKFRRHGKRLGHIIVHSIVYSFVAGVIFKLGLEFGRQAVCESVKEGNETLRRNDDAGLLAFAAERLQRMRIVTSQLLNRNAPGEMGRAYVIQNPTEEQKALIKQGWDRHGFNEYVSDQISVDRSLPDLRHPDCKSHVIPKKLPPTSVIICFHNEAWSALLRSVHSVINRTPSKLLQEIILVDDASTFDSLKTQLDHYMKKFKNVRILRSPERSGLIRARILGAKAAVGNILTFLDSHIEVTDGWLEPLLARIARNSATVVCPDVQQIQKDTLKFSFGGVNNSPVIGVFDWTLLFGWQVMPPGRLKHYNGKSLPYASPTMIGGLFAIDRGFFEKLGYYDPGFDVWGGENLELSFKIWMCGGRLEIVPCSHVGHIFRPHRPYDWGNGRNKAQVLEKNLGRLAKVWTDEYSRYYFAKQKSAVDYGDISDRIKLRKDLQCKSFHWYLQNVYPEVFFPDEGYAYGEIRNMEKVNGNHYCLDAAGSMGLFPCHGLKGNQLFSYSRDLEIRRDSYCMDYFRSFELSLCHGLKGNQMWQYDVETKLLRHAGSGKCMAMSDKNELVVLMTECRQVPRQQWTFENYNPNPTSRYIDRNYLNLEYVL